MKTNIYLFFNCGQNMDAPVPIVYLVISNLIFNRSCAKLTSDCVDGLYYSKINLIFYSSFANLTSDFVDGIIITVQFG